MALPAAGAVRRAIRHDFVGHAGLVFASSLALNVFNYFFHFVISRNVGAASYGVLQSSLAIFSLLSVPSGILALIIVKYVAEIGASGDASKIRWLTDRLIRVLLCASVALLLLFCAAVPYVSSYLHIADPRALLAIGVMAAAYVLLPCLRAVLQGVQDFGSFAISIITEGAGKAGLGIGLVYLGFGVTGALAGAAAGSIVALLYTYARVGGALPHARTPFTIAYSRLLESGGGAFVASLSMAVWTSVDILMVKHFFPAKEAGLYAAAALVGRVLLFVVGFLPVVLLPKVTALAAEGRSPRKIMAVGFAILAASSIIGLLALAYWPSLIVRIMAGRAFLEAAPLLVYYGITMTLLAGINLAVTYKIAVHRFDFAIPLVIAMVGELAAMQLIHSTLLDILRIIIVGHSLALCASLYRIAAPVVTVDERIMEHLPEVS